MIDSLSNKITSLIKNNLPDISNEKEEIINYGMNIFIYQTLLLLLIFSLALVTGLFKYIFIFFIVYALLRAFTGGAHSNTRIKCATTYIFISFGTVLLSKHIWADSFLPAILLLLINLIIIWMYAPGDTIERPVLSKRVIKRQKTLSLLIMIAISAAAIITWHYDKAVYNIILISSETVIFLLTPYGYKLLKCRHSFEDTY